MQSHVHHAHLFASDLDVALKFYQERRRVSVLYPHHRLYSPAGRGDSGAGKPLKDELAV
jgi:hypothetical protein